VTNSNATSMTAVAVHTDVKNRPPLSEAEQASRRASKKRRRNEAAMGWLFVSPVLVILLVFLIIPILLALYISFTKWNGQGGPFSKNVKFVGLNNYRSLIVDDALTRKNFVASLRNNFYFVLFVVPIQTVVALSLALVLNQAKLKAKGFFRTAFYIPSLSSSIAIGLIFVFLFSTSGAINQVIGFVGVKPVQWFNNSQGIFHEIFRGFGVKKPPTFLASHEFLGMSFWNWLSGPSWSMLVIIILAIWTTSGTFMLLLLAGLQTIPQSMNEAAAIDGSSRTQTLRYLTIPLLKKQIVLVITLGLIGTWQVFDQIYIMSDGAGETVTPAYLAYTTGVRESRFGGASALAFIVFGIILVFTAVQRYLGRDKLDTA
jgi:multiple sugar transport system permease protein